MQKPLDLGHKVIDAASVTCIKPVSAEQLGRLNSAENWTLEARALGGAGGYIADADITKAVGVFAKLGERLSLIPETGEAVRRDWLTAVKPFASREGAPNKFRSVATFTNPASGEKTDEWFAATPEQLRGSKAPAFKDLAAG